ncbi:guanylate-binding protein 1-like [Ambystoma mexicanum]|uniref:guanylate-binding protein 1-like n=1 Tax=Ambystoma mexicanum TaxID=8296 RepID=UPI0037E88A63
MPEFDMPAPVCFIENTPEGELRVRQEALEILSNITQPVVVVAVVGLYRTGKSFLMNKLAGKRTGFSLGSTIQSETKGIWMWCVPHPKKPNHTLVLLDTEGLGDVEKGDSKNDSWIFALSVLLSSAFVYNSMGTIDQRALEQLHYVTELTERIKVKSKPASRTDTDETADFMSFFPTFIWTVRDFTLELKLDGHPITEDEYLENALLLKKGSSPKLALYNLPRECIRLFFPTRKCFVFDRPASKQGLQRIEELRDSELEPDFVAQAKKFCQYIFEKCRVKTLKGGYIVTGKFLGNLAVTYLDAIRSGAVPCMENAVLALAQIENSAAVMEAGVHYQQEMTKQVKFPTATLKEFLDVHAICEKGAIQLFMDRSFKDDNREFQGQLMGDLEMKKEAFLRRNEQESSARCQAMIQDFFQPIQAGLSAGTYSRPGGYQQFMVDQQDAVRKYNQAPRKGIQADEELRGFLMKQETIASTILQTDQALTAGQKAIEEERLRADAAERERLVVEEKHAEMQQKLEDQKRSYEEHVQQLMVKMEEDRKKLVEENERVLTSKLKEQENMLREGFQEQANSLQSQIQDLCGQLDKANNKSSWFSDVLDGIGTVGTLVLPGIGGKLLGVGTRILSRFF